ncbi:MAG: Na/Pi cotransporter family protein, partial [Armatimonadota bacterium]
RQVANSHTLFNVLVALLFLVFNAWFAALLERWIPDRGRPVVEMAHIDRRLLETPVAAAGATLQELGRMARACRSMVRDCTEALLAPERADFDQLWGQDKAIDHLQESITEYLVALMEEDLPQHISRQLPAMLHVTNDFERVGDHCKNLIELAEERLQESLVWSDAAHATVREMAGMIDQMLELSVRAFAGGDGEIPARILDLEEAVNQATERGRAEHMERARAGICLALPGVIFLDTLMNYEKMGDHVRNVAHALADGLMEAGAVLRTADVGEPTAMPVPGAGAVAGPLQPQPQPSLPLEPARSDAAPARVAPSSHDDAGA